VAVDCMHNASVCRSQLSRGIVGMSVYFKYVQIVDYI